MFLVKSLAAVGEAALAPVTAQAEAPPASPVNASYAGVAPFPLAMPFDLADVQLLDSPFKLAMERDSVYLLSLEPDRFLHNFRLIAGLPPKAPIYGGWESQPSGAGRCLGHYLSALAIQFRSSGDDRFKDRLAYLVDELKLCQDQNGDGYLAGMLTAKAEFADIVRGDGNGLKGQHPWYILHKLYAGLRDAYLLSGNQKALTVLIGMSDWAIRVTEALSDEQFQIMLRQEPGGMREVMADVYAITGDKRYLVLSERFYHHAVEDPLAKRQDDLRGLHANTQIPKIIGDARAYELTGEAQARAISEYFWETVVHHHSFVIGGNSVDEHFSAPGQIASHLTPMTAETCNTYNMLKLTRHLFTWDPRVEFADYYERALYNHILASVGPEPGQFTYYVSLKPGHHKSFSTPYESFWCCVGTGMENHVKYGDSIYFHDDDTLFVNLFIPSVLTWREKGLTITQTTKYPEADSVHLSLRSEDEEAVGPVPQDKIKELGELCVWLYGSKKEHRPPVIESQNPDLIQLNAVLKNRQAISALRAQRELPKAFEISRPPSAVFEEALLATKRQLTTAMAHLALGYDGSEELLRVAGSVANMADTVYTDMERKRNPEKKSRLTEA